MVINKIDNILSLTAANTSIEPHLVGDVINHLFTYIKSYVSNPTKKGLRITYLGLIFPHKKALNHKLRKLLKEIRVNKNEAVIAEFRELWKLKQLINE